MRSITRLFLAIFLLALIAVTLNEGRTAWTQETATSQQPRESTVSSRTHESSPTSSAALQEAAGKQPAAQQEAVQASKEPADKAKANRPTETFLRVLRNKDEIPTEMQTSITRYVYQDPAKSAQVHVDLIGAVHIADKTYYDALNKRFKTYDAVLYELVAPEGAELPKPGEGTRESSNPLSAMQRFMQTTLELQFQLDCIDYTVDNMVHADMTPEEFAASMRDRGESFLQMFFRILSQSMTQPPPKSKFNNGDLLAALFAKDRGTRLKRIMADQFENMEAQMSMINGPDGSTLITERNKKAFQVLKKQLDQGTRRIAVFYGAGHLPDMEERLIDEFKMKRTQIEWLPAWEID